MKAVPAVCVVGRSGVGKTTLIEALVKVLRQRGVTVGLVKHTHHHLALETSGSDSHRLAATGAPQVVLSGPGLTAVFRGEGQEIDATEAVRLASPGCALVLVEGFKSAGLPRVEVVRGGEPVLLPGEARVTMSDRPLHDRQWLALHQVQELADRIADW